MPERTIDCPECGSVLQFTEISRLSHSRKVKDVERVVHSSPDCQLHSFELAGDIPQDVLEEQRELRAAFIRHHLGWDR